MKIKVTHTDEIEIDLETCAKWFAELDDEKQAQFFIEVAKHTKSWPSPSAPWEQFYRVGSHLKTCQCSTDQARDIIEALHHGLETGTH